MLYIPKIDDYLTVLTDDKVKDFAATNFSEYFRSSSEKLYWKLSKKQNLRKVAESLHIFLTIPDEIEKYVKIMQLNYFDKHVHRYICTNIEVANLFDPELQLINTKTMIENKLKEFLSELKKVKLRQY